MPHGNVKSRSSRKKNGKGTSARKVQSESEPAASGSFGTEATPPSQLRSSLYTGNYESIYACYKQSTQRFKDALQSMVPSGMFATDHVHVLLEATDYVVDNNIPVESILLSDLKLSIRVRQQVSDHNYEGGDLGHQHFIQVLKYCWSHLAPLRLERKVNGTTTTTSTEKGSLCNRFEMLSLSNTDGSDSEDDLPNQPQARPTEPIRLTLQKLIDGTDRLDIIYFTMVLNEFMTFTASQCKDLMEKSKRWRQRRDFSPSVLTVPMMEVAAAANLSIQKVADLEKEFIRDHPHLNTIYRMLANLVLVDLIRHLTGLVAQKSPIASQFTENDAAEFVGDAMECFFRCSSDPQNKSATLVTDFLTQWQFPNDSMVAVDATEVSVRLIFECVQIEAANQVPFQPDIRDSESSSGTSHSWLPDEYIGQNRSIVHTIRLLQHSSNAMKERRGRFTPSKGSYGSAWVDQLKPSSRIQRDMDDMLMVDILPSLVNMCREGILSMDQLPYSNELFTGFTQIKEFLKDPEGRVSWALAYTIHTILTSIFELQGSNQLKLLAEAAQTTFKTYANQMERVEETYRADSSLQSASTWATTREHVWSIPLLVNVNFKRTHEQTLLSSWNPYCAGCFLSYFAYYVNLDSVTRFVDSCGQLRATLHLFNALKQMEHVRPGQILMLDRIFMFFKDCNAAWKGNHPVPGQFQARWRSIVGLPSRQAQTASPSSPILLEDLSKSFQQICRNDDVCVAPFRHNNVKRLNKHGAHINRTLDATREDEHLLATNWIYMGMILDLFYNILFRSLGLMSFVDDKGEMKKDEDASLPFHCMAHVFGERILGPLDARDASMASTCAFFMTEFFNKIPKKDVLWFVARQVER